jgi:hypothetical protein
VRDFREKEGGRYSQTVESCENYLRKSVGKSFSYNKWGWFECKRKVLERLLKLKRQSSLPLSTSLLFLVVQMSHRRYIYLTFLLTFSSHWKSNAFTVGRSLLSLYDSTTHLMIPLSLSLCLSFSHFFQQLVIEAISPVLKVSRFDIRGLKPGGGWRYGFYSQSREYVM